VTGALAGVHTVRTVSDSTALRADLLAAARETLLRKDFR
jgi:hypothetical protein